MGIDINILRLINVLVALSSLPPSLYLLILIIRERKALSGLRRNLNNILVGAFFIFSLSAVLNAVLSFLLFIGFDFSLMGDFGQYVFNLRNIIVNIAFATVSWGLFYINKRRKAKK